MSAESVRRHAAEAFARSVLLGRRTPEEALSVGTCLEPFIHPGEQVRIDPRPPQVGEIAIYRLGRRLKAHRVIGRAKGILLVRPDRLGAPVERVAEDQLLGTWSARSLWRDPFHTPKAGRLVALATLLGSRPAVVERLRSGLARLPSLPGRVELAVAKGETATLARELSEARLLTGLATVEELGAALLADTGFAVLARARGRIAGGVTALPWRTGLLLTISLRHLWRGRGVGTALMPVVLAEARGRGLPRLFAELPRTNARAVALFRRAGFQRTASDERRAPNAATTLDLYTLELCG